MGRVVFFFTILIIVFSTGCTKYIFESNLYEDNYNPTNEVYVSVSYIWHNYKGAPQSDYYIDKYEYPNNPVSIARNEPGEYPLINVDWYEANEYCEKHGKRLCTIEEWREACRGNGNGRTRGGTGLSDDPSEQQLGFNYPYTPLNPIPVENVYDSSKCNTENVAPMKSGSKGGCINPEIGVMDQSGNVWEWVYSDFNDINTGESQLEDFEGQMPIMGGYYNSKQNSTCNHNIIVDMTTKSEIVGFRCCRDAM